MVRIVAHIPGLVQLTPLGPGPWRVLVHRASDVLIQREGGRGCKAGIRSISYPPPTRTPR